MFGAGVLIWAGAGLWATEWAEDRFDLRPPGNLKEEKGDAEEGGGKAGKDEVGIWGFKVTEVEKRK